MHVHDLWPASQEPQRRPRQRGQVVLAVARGLRLRRPDIERADPFIICALQAGSGPGFHHQMAPLTQVGEQARNYHLRAACLQAIDDRVQQYTHGLDGHS